MKFQSAKWDGRSKVTGLCKLKTLLFYPYSTYTLDTETKGSTVFRNPRALSSALAALGLLQPRVLGFLNTVDPVGRGV